MKLTKSQLREIIKEEIRFINEATLNRNGTDNRYYSDEFYKVEKLLLKGLTSILGNETSCTGEYETNFGDFESYKSDPRFDTNARIIFGQPDLDKEEFYIGVVEDDTKWLVKPSKVTLKNVMSQAVSLATKYKDKLISQEDSADGEDEILDADEAQRRYHNNMVKLGHRKGPIFSKKNFRQNYRDYMIQLRAGTSP
jgi:hypothetical protein